MENFNHCVTFTYDHCTNKGTNIITTIVYKILSGTKELDIEYFSSFLDDQKKEFFSENYFMTKTQFLHFQDENRSFLINSHGILN